MSEINIYRVSIALALIFILIVIDLVRKNKLLEKFSILWLIFSFGILILALFPDLTIKIAEKLNILYAPALLFLAGILFLLFYVLYLTKCISKQEKRIIKLTEELSILKEKEEKK